MSTERIVVVVYLVIFLLAASAPKAPVLPPATDNPDSVVSNEPGGEDPAYPAPTADYLPKPEDDQFAKGEVFIDEMDILVLESFPPQFRLTLKGSQPDPCHELRIKVNEPNAENVIKVEAYSVYDVTEICVQMVEGFLVNVSLGNIPTGKFTVMVNDIDAGMIEMP